MSKSAEQVLWEQFALKSIRKVSLVNRLPRVNQKAKEAFAIGMLSPAVVFAIEKLNILSLQVFEVVSIISQVISVTCVVILALSAVVVMGVVIIDVRQLDEIERVRGCLKNNFCEQHPREARMLGFIKEGKEE